MSQNCPMCGNPAEELLAVPPALKIALKSSGDSKEPPPGLVCAPCHEHLASNVSQGMRLRMEVEQKEKNKLHLWKNRVNLIKQGRRLMAQRAYSEAAVSYEKYIRVLEMVYNLETGSLSPEVFNNSKRSKEMTIIASVYWDLMRIYDTSPSYGDRMARAAAKLAKFLPFTSVYQEIINSAVNFQRSAKNPSIVKEFLRAFKINKGFCFIATATLEENHLDLVVLRRFRDEVLRPYPAGRKFIFFYYRCSPRIAKRIMQSSFLRSIFRAIIRPIVFLVKKHLNSRYTSDNY